jgi:hypothetical protein
LRPERVADGLEPLGRDGHHHVDRGCPGVHVLKLFSSPKTERHNKLECLPSIQLFPSSKGQEGTMR